MKFFFTQSQPVMMFSMEYLQQNCACHSVNPKALFLCFKQTVFCFPNFYVISFALSLSLLPPFHIPVSLFPFFLVQSFLFPGLVRFIHFSSLSEIQTFWPSLSPWTSLSVQYFLRSHQTLTFISFPALLHSFSRTVPLRWFPCLAPSDFSAVSFQLDFTNQFHIIVFSK